MLETQESKTEKSLSNQFPGEENQLEEKMPDPSKAEGEDLDDPHENGTLAYRPADPSKAEG